MHIAQILVIAGTLMSAAADAESAEAYRNPVITSPRRPET